MWLAQDLWIGPKDFLQQVLYRFSPAQDLGGLVAGIQLINLLRA